MNEDNQVLVGYSPRTAGANGLLTQADCIGNPSVVCIQPDVFAPGCYLLRCDIATDFQVLAYQNTGTTAAPVWTLLTIPGVKTVKLSVSSAQILALNGTPLSVVPAPGAGKTIEFISAFGRMNFLTGAYTTNLALNLGYAAASDPLANNSTLLAATATCIQPLFKALAGAVTGNDSLYVANAALFLSVAAGNPAAGAGSLDLYVTYKTVDL